MEPIYRQTQTITDLHIDCFRRLKPSALFYFTQEASGNHCDQLLVGQDLLNKQQLFWALVRQKAEVLRLPVLGETITVETWPLPTTRSAYPRATVAYDAQGRLLFRVIGLWALMNTQTRSMVLPGKSGVEISGFLRGTELAAPGSIQPKPLCNATTRQVHFSQLDRNGHMNNTRYLDWIFDLLPGEFHAEHPVKEMTICYLSEAREGQQVILDWQLLDGACLQVNAHREKTDVPQSRERVFAAQVTF